MGDGMNEEKEKTMQEKLCKQVEEKIEHILSQGIRPENMDTLYKLVDIHKDLANEDYWQVKKEDIHMRYKITVKGLWETMGDE